MSHSPQRRRWCSTWRAFRAPAPGKLGGSFPSASHFHLDVTRRVVPAWARVTPDPNAGRKGRAGHHAGSRDDWAEVFPQAVCTVTLVDRLVHRPEILEIDGDSDRLEEAKGVPAQALLFAPQQEVPALTSPFFRAFSCPVTARADRPRQCRTSSWELQNRAPTDTIAFAKKGSPANGRWPSNDTSSHSSRLPSSPTNAAARDAPPAAATGTAP
jgi:hypothetical protein